MGGEMPGRTVVPENWAEGKLDGWAFSCSIVIPCPNSVLSDPSSDGIRTHVEHLRQLIDNCIAEDHSGRQEDPCCHGCR